MSDDGLALSAADDGAFVLSDGGVVSVLPVRVVVPSGAPIELAHEGAVVVRGDVPPGSRIVAAGDVLVEGALEGASVHAGGAVIVREGVFRKGSVRAVGDVVVRCAESEASLEAGGNVFVRADAIGARIDAGRYVAVLGAITGGHVRARTSVEAADVVLGRAVKTRVEVHGVSFEETAPELRARIDELEATATRARGALAAQIAEAGAVKLAAVRPSPPTPAPLPAGRSVSRMRAATPASPRPSQGNSQGVPPAHEALLRTPPESLAELLGEAYAPLTTAAALRIDRRDDDALLATIDAGFLRARLALLEAADAVPFSARVFVHATIAAGVDVTLEGAHAQIAADRGAGTFLVSEGKATFFPRHGEGGTR